MELAGCARNPFVACDKEFPFRLAFGDEETIEANIVDKDTMGEVAPSVVLAQVDIGFMTIAFDEYLGGNCLPRSDGDYPRLND